VMQNWSCGYYLLYFAPFVPLFLLHRMWTLGKLKDVRVWGSLAAAAVATLVLTLPFLYPYQEAQRAFGIERPLSEIVRFSANAWSYLTASENLNLWGDTLRLSPRPEGETFLGLVPWLLAAVALVRTIRLKPDAPPQPQHSNVGGASTFRRIVPALLLLAVIAQLAGLVAVVLFGGFDLGLISARSPMRLLMQFVVALAMLLALSPRARIETLRIIRSPITMALACTILAMWLSLGPGPDTGLYRVLYDNVPGFNGVRVPARYAMIAGLFLAILAGYGMLRVLSRAQSGRVQAAIVFAFSALILIDGAAIPLEINRTWNHNEATPPAQVMTYSNAPAAYARIRELPAGTIVTEFPFGDGAWEIRYVYYAAAHRKPITNGYSGSFPPRYQQRVAHLSNISRDPESAWAALKESGTTHVVLHRNAFGKATGADTVESWLKTNGATEIERFHDGDVLLALPR
jgi:hypothetical protein